MNLSILYYLIFLLSPSQCDYHKPLPSLYGMSNRARYPSSIVEFPVFHLNASWFQLGGLFSISNPLNPYTTVASVQRLESVRCFIAEWNLRTVQSENATVPLVRASYQIIDTQMSRAEALAAAITFLVQENVTALIGPATSDESYSVANFVSNYQMASVSYSATGGIVTNDEDSTFLRTVGNDELQMEAITSLLSYFNWSLVIPVFTNDTYGLSFRIAFYEQIYDGTAQIEIDCETILPYSTSPVLSRQLNQSLNNLSQCVSSSVASVVILFMDGTNAGLVISSMSKNPENEKVTFIGPDSWASFSDMPEIFANNRFPLSFLLGSLGVRPATGNVTAFEGCYFELNPSNTNYAHFLNMWEQVFKCRVSVDYTGKPHPEIVASSLPVCSNNVRQRPWPISCSCSGLEDLNGTFIDSKVGYASDAAYCVLTALDRILYNCSSIPFGNYCHATTITGYDLIQVMKAFPAIGVTGTLAFAGNNREQSTIEIIQSDLYGYATTVGFYYPNKTLVIDASKLQFKTENSTPISAVVPDDVTFRSAIGLAFLIMSTSLIVLCLALMAYFYYYRNEKIIKKSSPFFCQLMLVGIIMILLSIIVWTLDKNALTCALRIWLSCIGFGLILGNLLAKTYRIFRIFSNVRVHTNAIRDIDLLKFSFAVIAMEIILVSITVFADGPLAVTVVRSTTDPFYSYIVCSTPDLNFIVIMVIILCVYNGILVILAAVLAFMTRNVDSAFNESKYIAATVYFYVILAIIVVPIYGATGDSAGIAYRQYLEQNGFMILAMAFTLGALFVPKIVEIRQQHAKATEDLILGGYMDSGTSRATLSRIQELRESQITVGRQRAAQDAKRPRFITSLLWRGGSSNFRNSQSSTRNMSSYLQSSEAYISPMSYMQENGSTRRTLGERFPEGVDRERRDSLGGSGISLPIRIRESEPSSRSIAPPAFIHFPPPPPTTPSDDE